MSEQLSVCKALAAMLTKHGEPDEAEVTFVANAALELGLTPEQNEEVMVVLKGDGEYTELLGGVVSRRMRTYLFRRVVAASLLDEKVEDAELAIIRDTSKAFDFDSAVVDQYLEWMKEGIAWEKRGAELMAKL